MMLLSMRPVELEQAIESYLTRGCQIVKSRHYTIEGLMTWNIYLINRNGVLIILDASTNIHGELMTIGRVFLDINDVKDAVTAAPRAMADLWDKELGML